MKLAVLIAMCVCVGLLIALPGMPAHSEPFGSEQPFNQAMVVEVTGAALAFIAPRTLDAIPIPQLALWGLRGLTTIDPRFSTELRGDGVWLFADSRPIATRPAPPAGDAAAWATVTAQITRAAWDGSEVVRRTGNGGVVRTFFDELFNHFDPYSRYAPPDEADDDRERRDGTAGIGVTLARRGASFEVRSVLADSPAAVAGVRAGDELVAIDDQQLRALDLAAVNAMIAGPVNEAVSLSLRGRDRRSRIVEVTRMMVPPETVTSARVGTLLVIHVSHFATDTGERLGRALERGLAGPRSPRGVVIDLRGNRGGLLSQAVAAADTLLDGGMVAVTVGRDPDADHNFVASGHDLAGGLPVVVLVDGRSASSAEILAAALADQSRAVIVGSSTLGKGLVQTVTTLPDGGELFVTWSRVLAPRGWPIQGLGVLPQVCTSLGQASVTEQLRALSDGHDLLARALRRSRDARAPLPAAEMIEIRNACPAAEARDDDVDAARYLIEHPPAYTAALLPAAAQ